MNRSMQTPTGRTSAPLARSRKRNAFWDKFFHALFLLCAMVAVLSVVAIAGFILVKGLAPFIPGNAEGTYSFWDFLTGMSWKPGSGVFGIGYMIVASIFATLGALVIGVPIGLFTAVMIAEVAGPRLAKVLRPVIELLAGIPSVLYGVFGYAVIAQVVRAISPHQVGDSLLTVILVLSIMILPTIVSIAESAIRAVPNAYREGAYALGCTRMEVIFKVVLPAARSGILAAVVLGIGRAIGETMAVILVAGNPEGGFPGSLFDKVRLITNNIVLEQGYASGLHEQMLFSTGVVLFAFIMGINLILAKIKKRIGGGD